MAHERRYQGMSGWGMLPVNFIMYVLVPVLLVNGIRTLEAVGDGSKAPGLVMVFGAILVLIVSILVSVGFMILQPNEAGVLVLFGRYLGTAKDNGFW